MSATCQAAGCDQAVSRPGHTLCYHHWKLEKASTSATAQPETQKAPASQDEENQELLSSPRLGRHFGLSPTRMNLVLAELGWIEKYVKGWTPTRHGHELGANVREARHTGVPYVVWPASILTHKVLLSAIREGEGDGDGVDSPVPTSAIVPTDAASSTADFRERFPARFRATDGHLVRSRAEMLIDNWLYMQGIVHAVERRLPIEEDVYCDFYLPTGKVYIEYWGLEHNPRYAARKVEKQAVYQRYGLNLVELTDDDIMGLDDTLPRLLLKFGIDCT